MDDLEERMAATARAMARIGYDGDAIVLEQALDRLRTYREVLEKIAHARTSMDGGSIEECRKIARQALKG